MCDMSCFPSDHHVDYGEDRRDQSESLGVDGREDKEWSFVIYHNTEQSPL